MVLKVFKIFGQKCQDKKTRPEVYSWPIEARPEVYWASFSHVSAIVVQDNQVIIMITRPSFAKLNSGKAGCLSISKFDNSLSAVYQAV